jgi:hypothetical protein
MKPPALRAAASPVSIRLREKRNKKQERRLKNGPGSLPGPFFCLPQLPTSRRGLNPANTAYFAEKLTRRIQLKRF